MVDANINPASYIHYGFSELLVMTFALISIGLIFASMQRWR